MSGLNQGAAAVPAFEPDEREHRRKLARAVNTITQGKINCTLDVTLTASAATTVINDARIGFYSAVVPAMAMTADAAADLAAGIYVTGLQKGQATLNHRINAATDRTIRFLILG
jgi:hypothetical protein